MKKVILSIDTTDNQKTVLQLNRDGKKKQLTRNNQFRVFQILLPLIIEILQQNNLNLKDLSEIGVNNGPGSFTGIRVGVTVANVLGWYLGIPVNGGKKPVAPVYGN